MIRVLLVEDEEDAARRVIDSTHQQDDAIIFDRVVSRSGAERALQKDSSFDLLVCDLRIPATDGGLSTSPEHGLAVQAAVARDLPGTPVFFLTGVAEDNIDQLADAASAGMVSNAFGEDRPFRMVQLFRKHRTAACVQAICDYAAAIDELDASHIEGPEELTPIARRAVALACRQWDGTVADVRHMKSGLTGAETLHAKIVTDRGVERSSILLKIDELSTCRDERIRYREFVRGQIDRIFPEYIELYEHLLGRYGCLVFKFVDDWTASLFGFVGDDLPFNPSEFVAHLRDGLSPWASIIETEERDVGEMRIPQISWADIEAGLSGSGHPDIASLLTRMQHFEDRRVAVRMTPQHGDLHGENVLLSEEGIPTLIDCGDISLRPMGSDAVTLELSFFFHPGSPWRAHDWPHEHLSAWRDIARLSESAPLPPLLMACRHWAASVASIAEVQLAAYLYTVRQLKYDDTPKDTIAWLLEGILKDDGPWTVQSAV